jgi:uncharacterized delta-60 repeat protein
MNIRQTVQDKFSVVLFLAMFIGLSPMIHAAPGDVDLSFSPPNFSASGSFSSLSINASVLQPDGKIVVGGSFSGVDGTNHISLARLNADGSRDATFVSPFVMGSTGTTVQTLALQTDGKILVGGTLVTPGGIKTLVRVNADGSLDTTFVVAASSVFGQVLKIIVEPGGQILASGNYSGVSRLNSNGSFIESIGTILHDINSFVLQPDGKLVIGGIASFGGNATFRFVGTDIDPTFHGGTSMILPIAGGMELQPDGKIIIYGIGPVTIDGISRRGIIRLTSSGAVDTSLDAGNLGGGIVAIKLRMDGKIVVGGFFFPPGETNGYGFARLNTDGTPDSAFQVAPPRNTNDIVRSVNIQSDGKIIIGGNFTLVAGISRSLVARLQDDTVPSTTNLTINNVTLNEGNSGTTAFTFTVSLSAASAQTVTVDYATADGTAAAPLDYQAASGSLSFAAGETAKTVTVFVNGDTEIEASEFFTVNLTNATNATIGSGAGTGTILNDDASAGLISLGLNGTVFSAGATMVVTGILSAGTIPGLVDAYVVLQLPSGEFLSLQLGGRFAAGLIPIAQRFAPFDFQAILAQYTFSGVEPRGTYTWYAVLTTPGTLNFVHPPQQLAFVVP